MERGGEGKGREGEREGEGNGREFEPSNVHDRLTPLRIKFSYSIR